MSDIAKFYLNYMKIRISMFVLVSALLWGCVDKSTSEEETIVTEDSQVEVVDEAGEASEPIQNASAFQSGYEEISGPSDPDWGKGILLNIAEPFSTSESVIFPEESVPVYGTPGGKRVGKIKKDGYDGLMLEVEGSDETVQLSWGDMKEITYEGVCLLFFEIKEGFASVKMEKEGPYYWVDLEELEQMGWGPMPWGEFLLAQGGSYYPRPEGGLNLREQPEVDGEKIVTMKGDLFFINLTGERKGNWMKAKVEQRDVHPCEGNDQLINTFTGWFKALDDKGFPNIWYYTRGC